jgi:hypothetical protein
MPISQEKFQTIMPYKAETTESWTTERNVSAKGQARNKMPVGMDIGSVDCNMPLTLAGVADVSGDTNPEALRNGFTRRDLGNCEDQFTGEHIDLFYGDSGGFAERNNYLDRI